MRKSLIERRAPTRWAVLLVAAAATVSLHAVDPDLPYGSGSSGADGPLTFRRIVEPGRRAHQMVYDGARQQLVVFGGYADSVGYLNDTWVFDGVHWRQLTPAQSPPARSTFMMAFDAVRQKVVLFGGYQNGARNDMWTWDGTNWTQVTPATLPGPRYGSGFVWDAARQRVVMFGGNGGADQTWVWDGTNWEMRTPAARPPADNECDMAYDAARQRVLLQHGNRQTWLWDGTNWANVTPETTPTGRDFAGMAYDSVRQRVVLFGGSDRNDTWLWDGSRWTQAMPTTSPQVRRDGMGFAWDPSTQRVVLHGGYIVSVDGSNSDTWFWNGTDWSFWSGKTQMFDVASDADGVWNFTTIDVPPGVTVRFKPGAANRPVRWLATGDVTIRGTVDVSGEFGANDLALGTTARGGPGGFAGGRGGIRYDQSSSFAGTPGDGPGGGLPGTTLSERAEDGHYADTGGYGNVFIQPLLGGSGGGGGGSGSTANGGNGGGGGGAILIASSRDVTITGQVKANGGDIQWSGASYGGYGSGGGILIRADRISGDGLLQAYGGSANNANGRIRLEAYLRLYTGQANPVPVGSVPLAGQDPFQTASLSITRVAGRNVAQPPGGNPVSPDVVFSQAGTVEITVTGQGVPEGTPIRLRITSGGTVLTAGPAPLNGGAAQFNLSVPAGTGSIQAFADYRVGG